MSRRTPAQSSRSICRSARSAGRARCTTSDRKTGLLTVELPEKVVQVLLDDVEEDPSTVVTIDLPERQVRWQGEVHDFRSEDRSADRRTAREGRAGPA